MRNQHYSLSQIFYQFLSVSISHYSTNISNQLQLESVDPPIFTGLHLLCSVPFFLSTTTMKMGRYPLVDNEFTYTTHNTSRYIHSKTHTHYTSFHQKIYIFKNLHKEGFKVRVHLLDTLERQSSRVQKMLQILVCNTWNMVFMS